MAIRYRCWVTYEWIDEMGDRGCGDCHTRSCPVNVGFAADAEPVEVDEDGNEVRK